jgi:type IV fimbrial biogenesis protein FimT
MMKVAGKQKIGRQGVGLPRVLSNAAARGFTLIELMIVVIIVSVILAVGLPTFSSASLVTRLKNYANEMLSSVYLARGEAIKRSAPVRLCISADGSTCTTTGDWEQGWIVIDPNDVVLRHWDALDEGYKFTGYVDPNNPGSTAFHTLTFDPSGASVTRTPGGVGIATMNVCRREPSVGHQERKVTVSANGRARISTTEERVCNP